MAEIIKLIDDVTTGTINFTAYRGGLYLIICSGRAFSAQNAMIDIDNMTLPGPTTWGHDNE